MGSLTGFIKLRAHGKLGPLGLLTCFNRRSPKFAPDSRCNFPSSAGAAFIEFIICGVVVLIVFWAGVEFGNYLRTRVRVVSIMRETSSEMYRECFGLAPDPICLRDVAERIDSSSQAVLPGFGLISSFYACTSDDLLHPPSAAWRVRSNHAQNRNSKLDQAFPGSLQLLCAAHASGIVVSEGYYDYPPIIPFVWRLIGFNGAFGEVYVAALF